MPANAVEQLGDGLIVHVGQVRPIERSITRQVLGQIEAERDFALEPWLNRVSVCGNDLQRHVVGKRGNVLIEDLGDQSSVFSRGHLGPLIGALNKRDGHGGNKKHRRRSPAQ